MCYQCHSLLTSLSNSLFFFTLYSPIHHSLIYTPICTASFCSLTKLSISYHHIALNINLLLSAVSPNSRPFFTPWPCYSGKTVYYLLTLLILPRRSIIYIPIIYLSNICHLSVAYHHKATWRIPGICEPSLFLKKLYASLSLTLSFLLFRFSLE